MRLRGVNNRITTCEAHWRPSGGRGEFGFASADRLMDRDVHVDFDQLGIRIDAGVGGRLAQGKARLWKRGANNRRKLHLPQLVMAVAALPKPARSDQHALAFPLENKAFIIDQVDFDVIENDRSIAVLASLRASVLYGEFQVQRDDRLRAIAGYVANSAEKSARSPDLADAVDAPAAEIAKGVNSLDLRKTANRLIQLTSALFGRTNAVPRVAWSRPRPGQTWRPRRLPGGRVAC